MARIAPPQLFAAIAAQAAEQIAGEAFGMDARQHRAGALRFADQDGEMVGAAIIRTERDDARILGIGQWHAGIGDAALTLRQDRAVLGDRADR